MTGKCEPVFRSYRTIIVHILSRKKGSDRIERDIGGLLCKGTDPGDLAPGVLHLDRRCSFGGVCDGDPVGVLP